MDDINIEYNVVDYSVVIPVYNEEDSLKLILSELLSTMAKLGGKYEIIFVDDGSSDKSADILNEFNKEFPEVIKIAILSMHSGQTSALKRGMDLSVGEIVITLDADLQNDPADITKIIDKMKEGFDCVCGWRKHRRDTLLKTALSKLGNILQRLFTGMKIHDVSCTLRAYKRHCIDKIALDWEGQHRFIPLSLSLQKYKIGEVESNHRQRKFGHTKYSHRRIFKVMIDFLKVLISRGKK